MLRPRPECPQRANICRGKIVGAHNASPERQRCEWLESKEFSDQISFLSKSTALTINSCLLPAHPKAKTTNPRVNKFVEAISEPAGVTESLKGRHSAVVGDDVRSL